MVHAEVKRNPSRRAGRTVGARRRRRSVMTLEMFVTWLSSCGASLMVSTGSSLRRPCCLGPVLGGCASGLARRRLGSAHRSHPLWRDARPPYLGWRREGQHVVRETIRGPVRALRLVSLDRQREVIFSDRVPRFEELMGLVGLVEPQRHIRTGEPTAGVGSYGNSANGPRPVPIRRAAASGG